jgi:hypothetical protein
MSHYDPSLQDRRNLAAEAKKNLLAKFKKNADPKREEWIEHEAAQAIDKNDQVIGPEGRRILVIDFFRSLQ